MENELEAVIVAINRLLEYDITGEITTDNYKASVWKDGEIFYGEVKPRLGGPSVYNVRCEEI